MRNKTLVIFLLALSATICVFAQQGTIFDFKYKVYTKKCGNIDRACLLICKKCGDEDWCAVSNQCVSINRNTGAMSISSGPTSGDSCDFTGSYVNSLSSSYGDAFSESASLNGSFGCGPCGGSSSAGPVKQFNLLRYYSSRRSHRVWDMGLGQASNLDMRLTLSEENDGSLTIYLEAPQADFSPMYLDGRRGDTRDGVFHGSQQNASVEMHLLNDQDQVVLNYADATKIRFVDFKFTTYEFEIIAVGTDEYAGRLTSIKDLRGYGLEITYYDNAYTTADLINNASLDPAVQWRRQTVKDSTNRTFTFNYHSADLGGEYVISSVVLPNSSSINYTYNQTENYLSAVTYPDGTSSTYNYDVDGDGDTVYHAEETTGKVKDIYMSSSAALVSTHNGQILYNQNSMSVGTVKVNSEITYAYFQAGTANYAKVYTGEGQMKFRHIDRQIRYYDKNFTFTEDENGHVDYNDISGTYENKYLNKNYTGPNGIEFPSNITDEKGSNYKVEYDSINRSVFRSYSDNTFEAWSYNSLNQPTRYRDRLGRVTLKSYDAQGNLLIKQVGLLDAYTGSSANYNHKYWNTGNLAQIIGASASQSSKGGASKAIDTNTNGQYNMYSVTATNNEAQPWWKVQLVRSSLVNEVKIYNRKEVPERLADFTVKLFDGATEVYSETFIDPVESEGVVTVTLPAGTSADSVQVQLNGTNVLSLAEVEVFGSDSVVDAEAPVNDNATSAYAVFVNEYYPNTGTPELTDNRYLLKYEYDAMTLPGSVDVNNYSQVLAHASSTNDQRKEFIYNTDNLLTQIKEPDDAGTGYHPQSTFIYDTYNRLETSTDAEDRTTTFAYDSRDRLVKTTFNDGSTELTIFGDTNLTADLVVKRKDRNGNVTKFIYDNFGRVTDRIVAFSVMNEDGTTDTENDSAIQSLTTYTYLTGQHVPRTVTVDGDKTEYVYDRRLRRIETIQYPDANSSLVSSSEYKNNNLFKTTDPYGRRTYFRYRSSDSALIRSIQETIVGTLNLASYNDVKNKNRDYSNNANYLITDIEQDAEGQTTATRDPKDIRQESDYDSRGRVTLQVNAANSLDQTTEMLYDANSNVTEIRTPRYFSESINDITAMTYTRRNLLESRTVASGSSTVEATESFTYFDDKKPESHTDFRAYTSYQEWHNCCGRFQAGIDEAGHATFSSNDYYGNVTHTARVKDRASHGAGDDNGIHNPVNTLTLQEETIRYDERHRPIARTVWLDALGDVDPYNAPIEGDSGVTQTGLTTHWEYFDEVTGHDKLAPLIAELSADGITFDANNDGAAVITINPEGEVSVSIQDGVGRTIASGMYDKQSWIDFANETGPLVLETWQTVTHDTVVNNLLETTSNSALDNKNSVRTDGAGRRIETEDADRNNPAHPGIGNISYFEFDANSNLVKSRDANGVGQDCSFDDLNRDISCTDTELATTSRTYDLNNNIVSKTDAKSKTELCVFDERNRLESCTDRINGETSYTYDDNNNALSATDANNNTTYFTFDVRNLQTHITYADSGVKSCTYDAMGRKEICTDQLGDTVEYTYDLASRLEKRDYYLAGSTLESSDTFTFDGASRVLSANKGRYSNLVTMTFDGIGRKKSEKVTVGGNDYTITNNDFDDDNRLLETTYSAGNKVYTAWTDRNQLQSVNFNAKNIITSTYDAGMREYTRRFGNSLVNTMSYNLDNTRDKITVAGHADLSFTYTYDANKNVTGESAGSSMANYSWTAGFDDIDRVTSYNRTNLDYQTWTLDKIGNWDNTTGTLDTVGFNENRTHNSVHELNDKGETAIAYDDKGNMTTDANANNLVWDIDNHLQSFNAVTFTYDALGRRLEKKSTSGNTLFICNGQRVVEEYEDDLQGGGYTLARSYTHASYVDDIVAKVESIAGTTDTLYYHSDRQFNVRGISDDSIIPNVVETYAYSPYGQHTVVSSTATTNNSYGYTGRYLDSETELWYFRARYLNDEMGRFISRDPLGYVDGMSLYGAYFAERFALDPSGTFTLIELLVVISVIAIIVTILKPPVKKVAQLLQTRKKVNATKEECYGLIYMENISTDCFELCKYARGFAISAQIISENIRQGRTSLAQTNSAGVVVGSTNGFTGGVTVHGERILSSTEIAITNTLENNISFLNATAYLGHTQSHSRSEYALQYAQQERARAALAMRTILDYAKRIYDCDCTKLMPYVNWTGNY